MEYNRNYYTGKTAVVTGAASGIGHFIDCCMRVHLGGHAVCS
jgi:NAD(P)-dependent dehydrogenase (short-subunit alcohol dehydrogenase family)